MSAKSIDTRQSQSATSPPILADADIIATLEVLGGRSTARRVCDALVTNRLPKARVQLALQRAMDRGVVLVDNDWSVFLPGK